MNAYRTFLDWMHNNYPELGNFYDSNFSLHSTNNYVIGVNNENKVSDQEFQKLQAIAGDYQLYRYATMLFHS